jgi:hypothetical protein
MERLPNAGTPCYTESGSTANDRKERTTMTIGDKCPYCGRELLSGYLQSARQIIWSQEEKSISFRADEDGDLVVSHGIWEGSFADCRYCADCGIFLLERPAQPPKFGERLRGKFGRLRGGDTME